jgi:hypothetical protein
MVWSGINLLYSTRDGVIHFTVSELRKVQVLPTNPIRRAHKNAKTGSEIEKPSHI